MARPRTPKPRKPIALPREAAALVPFVADAIPERGPNRALDVRQYWPLNVILPNSAQGDSLNPQTLARPAARLVQVATRLASPLPPGPPSSPVTLGAPDADLNLLCTIIGDQGTHEGFAHAALQRQMHALEGAVATAWLNRLTPSGAALENALWLGALLDLATETQTAQGSLRAGGTLPAGLSATAVVIASTLPEGAAPPSPPTAADINQAPRADRPALREQAQNYALWSTPHGQLENWRAGTRADLYRGCLDAFAQACDASWKAARTPTDRTQHSVNFGASLADLARELRTLEAPPPAQAAVREAPGTESALFEWWMASWRDAARCELLLISPAEGVACFDAARQQRAQSAVHALEAGGALLLATAESHWKQLANDPTAPTDRQTRALAFSQYGTRQNELGIPAREILVGLERLVAHMEVPQQTVSAATPDVRLDAARGTWATTLAASSPGTPIQPAQHAAAMVMATMDDDRERGVLTADIIHDVTGDLVRLAIGGQGLVPTAFRRAQAEGVVTPTDLYAQRAAIRTAAEHLAAVAKKLPASREELQEALGTDRGSRQVVTILRTVADRLVEVIEGQDQGRSIAPAEWANRCTEAIDALVDGCRTLQRIPSYSATRATTRVNQALLPLVTALLVDVGFQGSPVADPHVPPLADVLNGLEQAVRDIPDILAQSSATQRSKTGVGRVRALLDKYNLSKPEPPAVLKHVLAERAQLNPDPASLSVYQKKIIPQLILDAVVRYPIGGPAIWVSRGLRTLVAWGHYPGPTVISWAGFAAIAITAVAVTGALPAVAGGALALGPAWGLGLGAAAGGLEWARSRLPDDSALRPWLRAASVACGVGAAAGFAGTFSSSLNTWASSHSLTLLPTLGALVGSASIACAEYQRRDPSSGTARNLGLLGRWALKGYAGLIDFLYVKAVTPGLNLLMPLIASPAAAAFDRLTNMGKDGLRRPWMRGGWKGWALASFVTVVQVPAIMFAGGTLAARYGYTSRTHLWTMVTNPTQILEAGLDGGMRGICEANPYASHAAPWWASTVPKVETALTLSVVAGGGLVWNAINGSETGERLYDFTSRRAKVLWDTWDSNGCESPAAHQDPFSVHTLNALKAVPSALQRWALDIKHGEPSTKVQANFGIVDQELHMASQALHMDLGAANAQAAREQAGAIYETYTRQHTAWEGKRTEAESIGRAYENLLGAILQAQGRAPWAAGRQKPPNLQQAMTEFQGAGLNRGTSVYPGTTGLLTGSIDGLPFSVRTDSIIGPVLYFERGGATITVTQGGRGLVIDGKQRFSPAALGVSAADPGAEPSFNGMLENKIAFVPGEGQDINPATHQRGRWALIGADKQPLPAPEPDQPGFLASLVIKVRGGFSSSPSSPPATAQGDGQKTAAAESFPPPARPNAPRSTTAPAPEGSPPPAAPPATALGELTDALARIRAPQGRGIPASMPVGNGDTQFQLIPNEPIHLQPDSTQKAAVYQLVGAGGFPVSDKTGAPLYVARWVSDGSIGQTGETYLMTLQGKPCGAPGALASPTSCGLSYKAPIGDDATGALLPYAQALESLKRPAAALTPPPAALDPEQRQTPSRRSAAPSTGTYAAMSAPEPVVQTDGQESALLRFRNAAGQVVAFRITPTTISPLPAAVAQRQPSLRSTGLGRA